VIDPARRFTEAVLAGASAGVIGVDGEGRISFLNRSAEKNSVDRLEADVIGHPLSENSAGVKEVFSRAIGIRDWCRGGDDQIARNRERNLSVRVTTSSRRISSMVTHTSTTSPSW
jgi:two-component system nitrogen regulation sensor histidine kinase NtrY